MTFGSGGGSPKTIAQITDTAPFVQAFSNRDFYTCPLDTLAIVTPILFSFGSGSLADPEFYNFNGINIKHTDPITAAIVRYDTQYGSQPSLPYGSPHYGRLFLHPNVADTMNGPGLGPYSQRYDKYFGMWNGAGFVGYGGSIVLFPGETLSWSANNTYANPTNWKLKYGLVEYGIAS